MDNSGELDAAYRETVYRVDDRLALRIGQENSALEDFVRQEGVKSWAIITAFNPGSRPVDASQNEIRQREFEAQLDEQGFRWLPAVGEPSAGSDWNPEVSAFICGIDRADAVALGQRLGQRAIVASGRQPGEADLVYCENRQDQLR